jgi:thiol-disulfide isomerase/thioredoxin
MKLGKHVFILIYMEGCGPCNATRPEWSKMAHTLQKQYSKNKDIVIIDINKDLLSSIKSVGSINGFPTMKYITNKGYTVENYEDSSINKKDRSTDSFINWIESKINTIISTTSPYDVYNRIESNDKKSKKNSSNNKTRRSKIRKNKTKRGGKWSRKYKASIDCSNPKGFSQKQYCKYGRK